MGLGTQMQLRPNTTRAEFKVAYDWLTSLKTGRCNNCWQALSYAPFVSHAERQGPLLSSTSTVFVTETTRTEHMTQKVLTSS